MDFNRFDVSAKELIWDDPATWLDRLGIGPAGPIAVIDDKLRGLVDRMAERINAEPDPRAARLWTAAYQDIDRLETLGERVLDPDLHGWDALLRND